MRKRLLLLFFMFSLLLFAGTKEEMYSAIENNNLNEVKKLITSGYEFDYQTIELTMLKDRIEIMKVFLATSNDSIQSYFDSGIIMGNIKSKNMLILLEKLGYTSDYTIGEPGGFARPYIYALEYNNEQGALILMKNGVDLLEDNGYGKILGNRALKIAREKSFKNAIGYLNENGIGGIDEELYQAVLKNDITKVRKLIAEGSDIDKVDNDGMSLLMLATEKNNIDMMKFLISEGTNINLTNARKETALNYSTTRDSFKMLLDAGIKVNTEDLDKILRLEMPDLSNEEMLNLLNDRGIIISKDSLSMYLLNNIDNYKMVKNLIAMGADPNYMLEEEWRGTNQYSPLKNLVSGLHNMQNKEDALLILKFLIDNGADLNRYYRDESTRHEAKDILSILSSQQITLENSELLVVEEIIQILINNGVDINRQNEGEPTALMYAVEAGSKDLAEILINKGATVNLKGPSGSTITALMWAVRNNNVEMPYETYLEVAMEIVNMLLKNGVEINAQNEEGRTALMYAVSEGSKELTEILIKNGANVNLKDINGDTALIIAIGNENEEISELLIKSGANTNDKSLEGKKLLEMTESSAFRKKLIKLGVKW